MKQIFIFIIISTVFTLKSNAQCTLPHKSFNEFGSDTTAFIVYNFMDRSDCFKQKTLQDVKRELQIPIQDMYYSFDDKTGKLNGVHISVYNGFRSSYLRDNDLDYTPIFVKFENVDYNSDYFYQPIMGIGAIKRSAIVYDLCKDFKIQKTSVILGKNSKYYNKYKSRIETKSTSKPFIEKKEDKPFIPVNIDDFK